ncbi:hypothetical protein [Nonomuraea sp. NPDC048901]|uniref:hypothetical protein n=1 Tax=Nonomuraea sp. NPDC048901 TaxID=3155627 RepID=UPI0033C2F1E6
MKGLSVRQPWAYAIGFLGKDVENRSWSTHHRGLLAIHASAGWDGDEAQSAVAFTARCGYSAVEPARRQRSAIVAVVDLADLCCRGLDGRGCSCGSWAISGQCHWRLADVRPLPTPIPCKGSLGLWDLPAEVETAVRMQIDPPVQGMRDCRWCNAMKPVGHDCPASAVGCTAGREDGSTCGACTACTTAQRQWLATRQADAEMYSSPSDLDSPF